MEQALYFPKTLMFLAVALLALLVPAAVSLAQVPKAYVTNFGSSSVSVVDTASNVIETKIPVEANPLYIAANSDCSLLYVLDSFGDTISVIDTRSNALIGTEILPGGENGNDIAISPDDRFLYIPTNSGSILVLNTDTFNLVDNVPSTPAPQFVGITPDGAKVFIVGEIIDEYQVLDTATNTIVFTNGFPGTPDTGDITISPDGQRAYILFFNDPLGGVIVSTVTNQIIGNLADPGNTPTFLAFLPDGSKAYLSDFNNPNVFQYDPQTNTYTDSINIGVGGQGIGITPDGERAYVCRGSVENEIVVLNTTTNQIVTRIPSPGDVPLDALVCTPAPSVSNIPALSEWGLILMPVALGVAALLYFRRRIVSVGN